VKYVTEFRNPELVRNLTDRIHARSRKPARIMEFCGGHTVTIFRYGIRQLLPPSVTLVSGPGCPVCVTANAELDKAIAFASRPGVTVATFGDMFKVPGSRASLQSAKADGADVRMVYSPLDALQLARDNPDRKVVFLGIGFETTAPGVAASILQADEEGLRNYFVHCMHKLCPPVLRAILDSGEIRLDGLICPGHVSAVIGSQAWAPIAKDYGIPCVVSGFEPLDILQCVGMIVEQLEDGISTSDIAYRRGVKREGNAVAVGTMTKVFEPCTGLWRGVGGVPESGLAIRPEYERFDAEKAIPVDPGPTFEHKGCICGDVLRGVAAPPDCKLFGKPCTPEDPVGPCMVSSEGSCSAYYRFGGDVER
jgi:hydrogenase expression/formation protein HypD